MDSWLDPGDKNVISPYKTLTTFNEWHLKSTNLPGQESLVPTQVGADIQSVGPPKWILNNGTTADAQNPKMHGCLDCGKLYF